MAAITANSSVQEMASEKVALLLDAVRMHCEGVPVETLAWSNQVM